RWLAFDGISRKRLHDVPPQPQVHGEFSGELKVVLNVRSEIEVAKFRFQRKLAGRGIRIAEQEAGKGASRTVNCGWIGSSLATEGEPTAALLTFVVILIRPANFPPDIQGVASVRPEPVVIETQPQFAIYRKSLA